ncbi:hypothetical protein Tco_0848539 [Tanacetum coccineum]
MSWSRGVTYGMKFAVVADCLGLREQRWLNVTTMEIVRVMIGGALVIGGAHRRWERDEEYACLEQVLRWLRSSSSNGGEIWCV